MHVNEGELEICPVRGENKKFPLFGGKLQIKFSVRTKETEAIIVLFMQHHLNKNININFTFLYIPQKESCKTNAH